MTDVDVTTFSENTEPIEIHHHVEAICRALGLVPKDVRELTICPTQVIADVFLLNSAGSKYITEEGVVAQERRAFKVRA